jgi:hypothetical protein
MTVIRAILMQGIIIDRKINNNLIIVNPFLSSLKAGLFLFMQELQVLLNNNKHKENKGGV